MKGNTAFHNDFAVSELVGGIILIVIALLSFTVISVYIYPNLNNPGEKIELIGYVNSDGTAVIEHAGGKSVSDYRIIVKNIDGTIISDKDYLDAASAWKIGECIYPLEDIGYGPLTDENHMVEITIYSLNKDGATQEVFNGVLHGNARGINPYMPILISSLRTDTPDEDLICYSYPIIPDVNATTYIYNWEINGQALADLNMPFDTENNATAKDYSGNGLNATLNGVTWRPNGVVGGCCYFGGSSEYISMALPSLFYDLDNNDFTISLWVKSDDITSDNSVVLMGSKGTKDFIKLFLFETQIHFALVKDDIENVVRTENLSSNTWYHIAAVWDASEESILIYFNGIPSTETGKRNFPYGAGVGLLEIGHGTASSKFWDGYMDQLEIYKQAFSQNEVYQIYLSTKDGNYDRRVMVSEQTSIGQIWQCIVTPNDSIRDGTPVESNTLRIVTYPGGD